MQHHAMVSLLNIKRVHYNNVKLRHDRKKKLQWNSSRVDLQKPSYLGLIEILYCYTTQSDTKFLFTSWKMERKYTSGSIFSLEQLYCLQQNFKQPNMYPKYACLHLSLDSLSAPFTVNWDNPWTNSENSDRTRPMQTYQTELKIVRFEPSKVNQLCNKKHQNSRKKFKSLQNSKLKE